MGTENMSISVSLADLGSFVSWAALARGRPQAKGSSFSPWLGTCKLTAGGLALSPSTRERLTNWIGFSGMVRGTEHVPNEERLKRTGFVSLLFAVRTRHYHKTDN